MITLIALALATAGTNPGKPNYKPQHCYSNGSEDRPHLIKVLSVEAHLYTYQVWLSKAWSDTFANSFEAIETVYPAEEKCPRG
jgi:hypothetical protein